MDIEVIREPVEILIVRNFLPKTTNKKIFEEIIKLKPHFKDASIGSDNNINKKMRDNKTLYIDEFFKGRREQSILLSNMDAIIANPHTHEMLYAMNPPISDINLTNYTETQVSRYGGESSHYLWHQDNIRGVSRHLTMVYYVFQEPKKFKGGDILFTNGVTNMGKLVPQKPEPGTISITPENNMAVFFGAKTSHMVTPTKSPKKWDYGRFSINCWIGMK